MYHNKKMFWCHIVIMSLVMYTLFEKTKAIVGIDECQATPVIHFLQYPGCIPKPIPSYACRGRCSSYLQVSGSKIWQMERSCMCCQESGEREASVSLFCPKAKPGERKFRKCRFHINVNSKPFDTTSFVPPYCFRVETTSTGGTEDDDRGNFKRCLTNILKKNLKNVVTKAPLECMCRPCTSVEEYAIIPQEIAGFAEESPFATSAHFRRSPGLQ